ncbi:MAG: FAD-dependent oxidoreductase [Clostridia bacterium]|nr:FAD-dependent oxidoreductase [Clostridia bacterium]
MERTILIRNIRRELDASDEAFLSLCRKKWGIPAEEPLRLRIVRQAVDARKKRDICLMVHAEATLDARLAGRLLRDKRLDTEPVAAEPEEKFAFGSEPQNGRIVVVGLGPGGLFAAWQLAKNGYAPLVIERGKAIEQRVLDVESYWNGNALNPESNVAFGEGGAGTFSDGKLTTRIKDAKIDGVLRQLVACGAPEEIARLAKPHIGTDRLRTVVHTMREEIQSLGGEVRFSAKLEEVRLTDGTLRSIVVSQNGRSETIPCAALILAIGQGARDTVRMLFRSGIAMAPKAFAIGVRAEHPQSMINRSQYGEFASHPRLGAAEYRLTARSGERGVYTFCMCPGGRVVASASGSEQIVVNGMSDFARDGENANAAVVVQVGPEDFGTDPLAGLQFQERIEADAYRLGNGLAPACRVADYLEHRGTTQFGDVRPTYRPSVVGANLWDCLPDFAAQGVKDGLLAFGSQLKGYDLPDAVLTAVESRTSSPLRILRGTDRQSVSCQNLYPVGEGAGYAGGIVSAAVDGWHAAEAVMRRFRRE